MQITEVKEHKKWYLELLLLADEQEDMIDRYLERGTMYVLEDDGIRAECVVTDEGDGVLELKNRFTIDDIRRIVDLIEEEGYLPGIIFIAFDVNNLIDLRAILPEQPAQLLVSFYNDDVLPTLKKYHLDLDIHYKALTPEIVRDLKAAGITINCWTVDTAEEARDLIEWGVDQITSNILE